MSETQLRGSLLLDFSTTHTAPKFFSLLALVLRAAGMKVVLVGKPGDEKSAAQDGLPFTDFHLVPASSNEGRVAKFNWAMQLLREGPVIWPDVDLGTWGRELPRVDNVPGLVILNWAAVAAGEKTEGVAQA